MSVPSYSLQALADHVHGTVHGDAELVIHSLATLASASMGQLSFFDNPKYLPQLQVTQAGAVIVAAKDLTSCPTAAIVVDNPYLAYAKIAQLFWRKPKPSVGIHPTAIIHPSVQLGANVSIGPYVVIEADVVIGDEVVIGAHSFIGEACHIGSQSEFAPRVTLYHGITLGTDCVLHSGVVIGSDGFGFAPHAGGFEKIPQLGGVRIGDRVEIGANTTIDRGALEDTVIGEGVKLDNQIQLGHNVKIGAHTVIAGCTGVAGSAEIGSRCMIGGAAAIGGHIKIADQVMVTGMAMVTHSITEPGVYASGTGILPRKEWQKCTVRFRQLNELAKTVAELKKTVQAETSKEPEES
jgi:UDP-3-O-[3-hydroxymyristoyl] glucosamine N-acyltransferase